MKKIVLQTLLVLLVSVVGIMSVFITKVEASQASVSAGDVTAGQDLNVTLNIPANAVAAQADITVKFSDGKTKTSKIAYMNGLSSNSVAISTKDMAAGAATITASNIVISDSSGKAIESGGSTSANVNINGGSASTPSTASNTATTTPSTSAETPAKTSSSQAAAKPEVKNPSFKDINETVYATAGVNVRSSCTTSGQDNIIGGLVKGQEVTRTGNAEGWSRIKYNGSTAYVASRLLTTTKPETPEEEEKPAEEPEAPEEKSELDTLKEKIGVLPEVGNNVATQIYKVITVLSIIGCAIIIVYLYKKDV